MAILDFLNRKRIEPSWTYRSKGVIWRLVPSETGLFIGEERVIDSKQTSFFGLSQQSGKLLWGERSFVDQWWVGIEAVHHDLAFLHGFVKPDMPQHRGITAIDLRTGLVSWSNPDIVFALALDNSVYASSFSPDDNQLYELDSDTGTLRNVWIGDTDVLKGARARIPVRVIGEPEFPSALGTTTILDERASRLAHSHSQTQEIVGTMEVLQNGEILFMSYHEKNGSEGFLRNVLRVIHLGNGREVFKDIVNSHVQTVVPDSFFLLNGMLYFIKDRFVLTAVSLNELNLSGHRDR